jgi:uncharacterized protein YdeI (YjbR/CyaY-like superfamily)
MKSSLKPKFFKTREDLRKWFIANHKKKDELIIGFYKKATGKQTVLPDEAVDEALCFGWIDGIRHRINDESFQNRYTPRRPNSNWSRVNIKKVKNLIKQGLMQPAGLKEYKRVTDKRINKYSFEQDNIELPKEFEKIFKKNKIAWKFFQSQAPYYRRTSTWFVMNAKREDTRVKRLDTLIKDSENGLRIKELRQVK